MRLPRSLGTRLPRHRHALPTKCPVLSGELIPGATPHVVPAGDRERGWAGWPLPALPPSYTLVRRHISFQPGAASSLAPDKASTDGSSSAPVPSRSDRDKTCNTLPHAERHTARKKRGERHTRHIRIFFHMQYSKLITAHHVFKCTTTSNKALTCPGHIQRSLCVARKP